MDKVFDASGFSVGKVFDAMAFFHTDELHPPDIERPSIERRYKGW